MDGGDDYNYECSLCPHICYSYDVFELQQPQMV